MSEINYAPTPPTPAELLALPELDAAEFEFIELINVSTNAIDLSDARFVEGITFTFPSNTVLAAGARILVVENLLAFELRYGAGRPVAGQFSGSLNNGGEKIRLQDAVGENILTFEYDNSWLPTTDGVGRSLSVRDPDADYTTWDVSDSWRVSAVDAGTPGWDDTTLVDDDLDGMPDAWEMNYFATTNDHFQSNTDGDGLSDGEEYVLGFDPNVPDAGLDLEIEWMSTNSVVRVPTVATQGVGYTNLVRVYTLEETADLDTPFIPVPDCTDIVGLGQMIQHTNDTGSIRYYRAQVELRLAP